MEDDVRKGSNPEMTTDRDRVEAALRAAWPDEFRISVKDLLRARMSRALAAADALALPPVRDRDYGGRLVREAWVRWARTQPDPKPSWLAPYEELSEPDKEADRQIAEALWSALAPPPVPEDVRKAIERLDDARGGPSAFVLLEARKHYEEISLTWLLSLLAAPAPPDDTGDEARTEIEALRRSEDEWASKTEAARAYANTLIEAKNRSQARAEAAEKERDELRAYLARLRGDRGMYPGYAGHELAAWEQKHGFKVVSLEHHTQSVEAAEARLARAREALKAVWFRATNTRLGGWKDGAAERALAFVETEVRTVLAALADSKPAGRAFTAPARDGIEAQRGLNDVFPGDPYPVASLIDIRRHDVQALFAGISRRDWHATETAANQMRDRIDRLLLAQRAARTGSP